MVTDIYKKRRLPMIDSQSRRMQWTTCSASNKRSDAVAMQKLMKQKWKEFWLMLDKLLHEKYPSLATKLVYVEGITGIRKDHVLLGVCFLAFLYIVTSYFASISSDFISLAYPLYCSIKAKEASNDEHKDSWLTYWIVYSALILTEYFAGRILSLLPAYFLLRTFFIIWCMSPYAGNGSNFVYGKIIQPFFLHHQDQMESALNIATTEMTNLSKNVMSAVDENCNDKED